MFQKTSFADVVKDQRDKKNSDFLRRGLTSSSLLNLMGHIIELMGNSISNYVFHYQSDILSHTFI